MHRAAHSSSQVLGGERYRLITPQCETLWCSLCGRSVGRSDSCALREPPSLAWLDKLATTWNTVWSHIKPCLRAASDNPARFAGVRVLGVDERCVASPGPTSTGPRELIGIVDHSREGSPHGAGPLPGTERTPSTINSKTPPASSMPSISSSSLATFQVRCVARVQQDTTSHCGRKGDPLYQIRLLLRASRHRLTPRQVKRNASVRPSRQMRRISVSTSPTFTGQVREVFHQATPAQGQRLAAYLIQRLPPVPFLKSLAWAGRYASGRTHSTPTSTPTEPATAPRKPSTDIIELGRRIARGYRNPINYQLRMLIIAGGLDASTHTQL